MANSSQLYILRRFVFESSSPILGVESDN
jgi:hypothetical protein